MMDERKVYLELSTPALGVYWAGTLAEMLWGVDEDEPPSDTDEMKLRDLAVGATCCIDRGVPVKARRVPEAHAVLASTANHRMRLYVNEHNVWEGSLTDMLDVNADDPLDPDVVRALVNLDVGATCILDLGAGGRYVVERVA